MGNGATDNGSANAVVLGRNASVGAGATGSVAIGNGATVAAGITNSVSLGQNSTNTRANTVSVGSPGAERQITNVAPGTVGTDAVNLNQLNSVAAGLQDQISNNQREARRGIAMALAANGYQTPIRPGGTTVSVSGGFFTGASAVGVSAAHRFYRFPGVVLHGSYANGGGSEHAGKVGAGVEF
jgi:autotransporter adhesin